MTQQVGDYSKMNTQTCEFINTNRLQFAEGCAIQYICRHSSIGNKDDIVKAIHYLEMIILRDYGTLKKIKEENKNSIYSHPSQKSQCSQFFFDLTTDSNDEKPKTEFKIPKFDNY
jgi:hypothetical protein